MSRRERSALQALPLHAICVVVGLAIVVPVLFGVLGGFKDNGQLATRPFGLPSPWVPENYLEILGSLAFWRPLGNSVLIAVLTTLLVVFTSAMAAFVFARYAFRGRELLFTLFTIGLMFPFAVAILPLFIVLRQAHLLNNPLGVAMPQAAFALPISIVIMRPFFRAIPKELQDAAAIDGCGPFRFYWSIVLPLSRPVLSTGRESGSITDR